MNTILWTGQEQGQEQGTELNIYQVPVPGLVKFELICWLAELAILMLFNYPWQEREEQEEDEQETPV